MDEREFAGCVSEARRIGENTGRLTSGVQWFGFGAWKRS
jgi:hypothetical protein